MFKILTRRTVRIKTMQLLYANAYKNHDAAKEVGTKATLQKLIKQPYLLYLYYLHIVAQTSLYVLKDKQLRAAKLRPTEDDKNLSVAIAQNPIVVALGQNETFKALLKNEKLSAHDNQEIIPKLYHAWRKNTTYIKYVQKEKLALKDHKEILKILLKEIMPGNELYTAHLDDLFITYSDDNEVACETATLSIQNYSDKNPSDFIIKIPQSDWQEKAAFGEELYDATIKNEEELMSHINPFLEHWEADRIASIDAILLRMALAELLYFPNIPIKVTINEYLDIAKVYSTPKSKDFINGVIDKLMKKLRDEGKIQKLGRGLVEN